MTLAAVSFGLFMIMLDNTVVNVALPSIQRDLGADLSELEWIVTGYALTFASLMLVGGKVADAYGRRLVFVVGIVVFTLASLLCGLAGSSEMLIGARVLQGAGAALMNPATLSIIAATFPPATSSAPVVFGSVRPCRESTPAPPQREDETVSDWFPPVAGWGRIAGMSRTTLSFGDNVRIRDTPLTQSLGLAGLTGTVLGETTPSVTGIEVIGEIKSDFAVSVLLDVRDESPWLSPELVEFLDHSPGITCSIGDHSIVRSETGEWTELPPRSTGFVAWFMRIFSGRKD
jgi:hypothetical protein